MRVVFVALLVLAAGCSRQPPIPDRPLLVSAGVETVLLGQAFPLTVVRTWSKARTPLEWSDRTLAPLAVKLIEASRREDGQRVEETRRYRAYAFRPGEWTEPVALRVEAALDPERPGDPELPTAPPDAARWPWVLAGMVLVAVLLLRRRRRRPEVVPVTAPAPEAPPGPHLRALERIEALRARRPDGREQIQAFYVEATGLLRDYIGERFGESTEIETSEELIASHPDLRAPLRHCDLVKFARHVPSDAERERMLDEAATFVRGSA